jgi:hypothetical protein
MIEGGAEDELTHGYSAFRPSPIVGRARLCPPSLLAMRPAAGTSVPALRHFGRRRRQSFAMVQHDRDAL